MSHQVNFCTRWTPATAGLLRELIYFMCYHLKVTAHQITFIKMSFFISFTFQDKCGQKKQKKKTMAARLPAVKHGVWIYIFSGHPKAWCINLHLLWTAFSCAEFNDSTLNPKCLHFEDNKCLNVWRSTLMWVSKAFLGHLCRGSLCHQPLPCRWERWLTARQANHFWGSCLVLIIREEDSYLKV